MGNRMNKHTYRILSAALLSGILLLSGCGQSEIDSLTGEGASPSGTPVAFSIRLQDTPPDTMLPRVMQPPPVAVRS